MVGARGFEPPASWSRTRRASQAALRPDNTHPGALEKWPEWNTQNNIGHRLSLECSEPAPSGNPEQITASQHFELRITATSAKASAV